MLTEFDYKIYISRSRSTNGTPLYYSKICYNLKCLVSSQDKYKKTKNPRKIRTIMSTQGLEKST
jgi:hypothetical protein